MTDNQRKFADEYVIDCNATRAYKAAYSRIKSENAARACASKLLTNPNIKAYIDAQLARISDEKTADAKEVMEYLTAVMRGETQAEIVVVEGAGDGISSATKITKAPDEKEKLKAAELLGKRFGLFDGDKNKATQDVLNKLDEVLGGIQSEF